MGSEKASFPVDMRHSKTSLLKFPIIKVDRVRIESWILTKVLKCIQLFSRPGKSKENR